MPIHNPSNPAPKASLRAALLVASVAGLVALPGLATAKDAAPNLGGGLAELAAQASSPRVLSRSFASARNATPIPEISRLIVQDSTGRALVKVTLNGRAPGDGMLQKMRSMPGVEVTASDMDYRSGVIEAYVPPNLLLDLANDRGVLSVVPSSPVETNVGSVDSQAIVQHRVDRVRNADGEGITIGILSDSWDTNGGPITAADDVASGDLPGPGNPLGNTEPVVVIEDIPGGSDEGRGMAQLVHDIAPKARLGFATAFGGEVGFANNIRALAGFEDAVGTVPGFEADIIVDDIIYLAEPFFQDGIIAQAVDEVAAAGVSYFSSAGNRPATQAYDSSVRIVPADPASWANTNLNMASVDPALYAGGFHNFVQYDGTDIAQTIEINPRGTIVFQWNEAFDPQPPMPVREITSGSGSVPPAGGIDTFTFDGTAGTLVEIFTDADPNSANPISDSLFTLIGPDGAVVAFQDTGTNPESLIITLPLDGTYTVQVGDFNFLPGDYIYLVQEVEVIQQVFSDYNLLFFLEDGTFIGALAEQNLFTNRPIELGAINAALNVQLVIARANEPADPEAAADRIRYVWFTSGTPQEYRSVIGPVTYGHNSARGAMGIAAYPFFAPYIPEPFTSPGPSTIYFDTDNNRLPRPEVRQKPDMAAMDGANNTFFGGDTNADEDDFPNFFGTSAAAPHAAAIAALVLDAAGGPGTVSPDTMRSILQRSAFPHDLDPYFASGFAWGRRNAIAITAEADGNGVSQFDPNVFYAWNVGRNGIETLSLNGDDANPTQTPRGIVFDERVGPGQPFVVGDSDGVDAGDVTATLSGPAAEPGVEGQWRQLDLGFNPGSFTRFEQLAFGIDRDEADAVGPRAAVAGNSADLLGNGVLIPEGRIVRGAMRFSGTFEDGSRFNGRFRNWIGRGYSQLDGYGFINAQRAVRLARRGH